MASFTFNRKGGYEPVEVDKYIENLEQQIHVYEDKSSAINKAIISAQCAADNMIKASTQDAKKLLDSAKAESEKILSDAKKEAERLVSETKTAHEKAVTEANAEKAKILEEAGNLAVVLRKNAMGQLTSIKDNISQQKELINSFSSDYKAFCEKVFSSKIIEEYNALREKYDGAMYQQAVDKVNTDLSEIDEIVEDLINPKQPDIVSEIRIEDDKAETVAEEKYEEVAENTAVEEKAGEEKKAEVAPVVEAEVKEEAAEDKAENKKEEEKISVEKPDETENENNKAAEEAKQTADEKLPEENKAQEPAKEEATENKEEKPVEPEVKEEIPAITKPGVYRVNANGSVAPTTRIESSHGTDILSRVKAGFDNPEQPQAENKGTDILSRVKAGFDNPEQPQAENKGTDILNRVKAFNNEQKADEKQAVPDILSRVRNNIASTEETVVATEISIKTGLSNSKETAGIPAPKSYLEPAKKLGPSTFNPDNGGERKPGIYRVPKTESKD